jgi:hypothetical protein
MNGLRVYVNPLVMGEEPCGHAMFYTRRADGPYYCWFYEELTGRWQVGRVHLPDSNLRVLRTTSWRAVPPELKAKMTDHYLE